MHAIFDKIQAISACQVEREVNIRRKSEGVLKQQRLCPGRGPLPGLFKVHVVCVQTTIHVDRPGPRKADRVGYNDVSGDLEQDFISRPYAEPAQETIQPHSSMTEAVRITGADQAREGTLVLGNIRSLNQLSWIKQAAQRNHAIFKGCCPANKGYTAG